MRTQTEAINAALSILGSQKKLSDALTALGRTVTQPAISEWLRRGVVPEDRCEPIEVVVRAAWAVADEATKAAYVTPVTVEELRPDLRWRRDEAGRVVGCEKPIQPTTQKTRKGRRARSNAHKEPVTVPAA